MKIQKSACLFISLILIISTVIIPSMFNVSAASIENPKCSETNVVKSSTIIVTNETFNGNLYIPKGVVLELYGTTVVTGNVYVLGALVNHGKFDWFGKMYAYATKSYLEGNTVYNGTWYFLSGTQSLHTIYCSSDIFNIEISHSKNGFFHGGVVTWWWVDGWQ